MNTHLGSDLRRTATLLLYIVCAMGVVIGLAPRAHAAGKPANGRSITFDMVPSAGAASCLPNAKGHVRVTSQGDVEVMDVDVEGLPANTAFDFFVIQVPHAPFGLSWYQGDIDTDPQGRGHGRFVGRFNVETFIVAPGSQPAPVVHGPDASSNPATAPVHTYHLGLWFNDPADAVKAGCPGAVTPFNGDHTAGIQVLNTSTFGDLNGPLRQLQ